MHKNAPPPRNILYAFCLLIGIIGYFAPSVTGWFALNDIVHYGFYLFLGMACAKYIPMFSPKTGIFGIIGLPVGTALYLFLPHTKLTGFAVSLCMLAALWPLSVQLSRMCPVSRKAVYAQTYPIFVLSWPCQLIAEIVLERILRLPFSIVFPAMLITGLTVPVTIIAAVDLFERKTHTSVISKMIGR